MFGSFDISTSGMQAQRTRMTTIAQNIANINTTRNESGQSVPYRRLVTLMAAGADGEGTAGVRVADIVAGGGEPRRVFDPGHPDAQSDGYVNYPNVNLVEENVDGIEAARAFQANVSTFESTKTIISSALRILA